MSPPLERVGRTLALLRERFGLSFEMAWQQAVRASGACGPEVEEAWIVDAWRRAYNGEPPTAYERELGERMPRGWTAAPFPDVRVCAHCDGPMPEGLRASALYCSRDCRRSAAYEREQAISHGRKAGGGATGVWVPTLREGGSQTTVTVEAHRDAA